jgi:hypothetical protein
MKFSELPKNFRQQGIDIWGQRLLPAQNLLEQGHNDFLRYNGTGRKHTVCRLGYYGHHIGIGNFQGSIAMFHQNGVMLTPGFDKGYR